ncbi:CPBP family intramembrane glutamic endopeptidase [Winogradskyella sp. UBA3174]|uniref:CPBP family intramembrane glutamic endopeptidase n=1 Tax=Winogradskyella sp. UBA3174 TaxID=1947785 RepID=UPI0025D3F415|nr:CPBP family intramembrane glutamic endopeptidase [Winogradskyella sp. UBA3174]|tara:strand:+ start:20296 stop:21255 length:960 start_codon:yes stop_codon:yes gene_type:complete
MNYIQQAYKGLHEGWRYLAGTVIIILFVFAGQIPFTVVALLEAKNQGMNMLGLDESTIMSLLEPNLNLFLMLLSFAVGLLGIFLVSKFLHKLSIKNLTTAREKIDWQRFWLIFFGWGILSSGLVLLDYYMSPEDYVWNFDLTNFLILAVIALALVPLQTSCEEYLFRGYLMQGIGIVAKNRWVPLIVTSVIFGMLHIANPEVDKLGYVIMIYYIGTGFFLGIMTLMDDGLELALGFHAANNLFTALLVTADWTAFQTYSILKDTSDPSAAALVDIVVPVFVIFPIILLILSKIYGWNNWREKLLGKVTAPPKEDYKIIE